jgi:peptide-methionine (S)-S-oxide reductase
MTKTETATFAGGCFWCTEAVFKRLKGVNSVLPGYAGGTVENPTYDQVSMGKTGHAEAIQIEFDPEVISYETLLDVFFNTHNPTTMNRQGNDVGPQYRSAIFYHNEEQKISAEKVKAEIQKSYSVQLVTEITAFTNFFVAEDYHKNYYDNHKDAAYCDIVISPKIQHLTEKYSTYLKQT